MFVRKTLALFGVMAAAAAGGAAYAGAQDDSNGSQNGDRSAQQRPDRGPGGCAGPGMHQRRELRALAHELGVSRAELRAALNAVGAGDRPDKDAFAADLAQALGVEESAVQEILDANRPDGRFGPGPGGPGDLVEALASGLNIDEAKVEDALEGLRDQRHDEFAAALAEELGLDAGDVADALDSVRPGPPPRP